MTIKNTKSSVFSGHCMSGVQIWAFGFRSPFSAAPFTLRNPTMPRWHCITSKATSATLDEQNKRTTGCGKVNDLGTVPVRSGCHCAKQCHHGGPKTIKTRVSTCSLFFQLPQTPPTFALLSTLTLYPCVQRTLQPPASSHRDANRTLLHPLTRHATNASAIDPQLSRRRMA